jgi:hypothetical protein
LPPPLTNYDAEQLEQDFPYWKRLHGFWRTLPNFNPYTASSEPGQDLAAEALTFVQSRGALGGGDDDDNDFNSRGGLSPGPFDADEDNAEVKDHADGVRVSFVFLMLAY